MALLDGKISELNPFTPGTKDPVDQQPQEKEEEENACWDAVLRWR